jgi:hypothetical protein
MGSPLCDWSTRAVLVARAVGAVRTTLSFRSIPENVTFGSTEDTAVPQ